MSRTGLTVTGGTTAMENSLAFQTFALPSAEDVTLNIGLGAGSIFHARSTVPSRLRIWSKALPQIMEPGYITNLVLTPSRVWFGEPMMVVQGTFKPDVHRHDLLWQAVVDCEQDCIAYFVHSLEQGCLFGPQRDKWGEFNINFFSFLGDKHD